MQYSIEFLNWKCVRKQREIRKSLAMTRNTGQKTGMGKAGKSGFFGDGDLTGALEALRSWQWENTFSAMP